MTEGVSVEEEEIRQMDEIYANGSAEDKGGEWTVRLERKKIIACGRWSRIEGMGVIQREKIKDCNHSKKIPWQSLNTKPVLGAERSAA